MKLQNSLALLLAAAGLALADATPGYDDEQQGYVQQDQYQHGRPKHDDGSWYPGKYEGPDTPYDDGKWYPGKYEPKGHVLPPQHHQPAPQHGYGEGHNDDDDNSLHKRQRRGRGDWNDDDDNRGYRGAAAGNSVPVLFGVGGLAAVMAVLL